MSRSSGGRRTVWWLVGLGVVAAGLAAMVGFRRQHIDDPWAPPR